MPVSFSRWEQATLPHRAAVALSKGGIGLHTGLAYQGAGKQARIIHLAWHHRLETEEAPSTTDPWFLIEPDLDLLELVRVASFCQVLSETRPEIPYALQFASSGFDAEGRFLPGPGEVGLTCATFVLAIFDAASVPLLERASWQQRSPLRQQEDTAAQQQLLKYLQRSAAPSHVSAVKREVSCARFRSEEVAAASHFPPATPQASATEGPVAARPVTFAQVEPEGRDLRERIEAILACPPPAASAPAKRERGRKR